jgi:hypothetical protein
MRRKQKGPPEGGPFMCFYRLDQAAADPIAQQRGPMQPRPMKPAIDAIEAAWADVAIFIEAPRWLLTGLQGRATML